MGLRSSSESGTGTFANGVTYSTFHCWGQSADWIMLLYSLESGLASSTKNSLVRALGRSPGITDFGFLVSFSFSKHSNSLISGGLVSKLSFFLTLSGNNCTLKGVNSWLIAEKCAAIFLIR